MQFYFLDFRDFFYYKIKMKLGIQNLLGEYDTNTTKFIRDFYEQ